MPVSRIHQRCNVLVAIRSFPSPPTIAAPQEKWPDLPSQMSRDFTPTSLITLDPCSLSSGTYFLATTQEGDPASHFYPLAVH